MKRFRKFLIFLGLIVLILLVSGWFFVRSVRPNYDGVRVFTGMTDSVRVLYSDYGIPHIYGKSEEDAYRALGYVHAQDRLWQMELLRRVARGGLSEVFGPDQVSVDKFFLSLGISDASEAAVLALNKESPEYKLLSAYLDGINEYIKTGPTPPEYYLTGLEKTTFKPVDVYNALGYMAFSFAMAHKTDPLLTEIRDRLGATYVEELIGQEPGTTAQIPVYDVRDTTQKAFAAVAKLHQLASGSPIPALEGSNSWVIAPSRTKSGKVLFANDPHIGFAQPSVWYEAHVNAPGYEKYGYHLAGIPFPLLGHNRVNAYGLTMFENDDIDFYEERLNPKDSNQYLRNGSWKSFDRIEKVILVKGGDPIILKLRKSDIGMVVNDVIPELKDKAPVSMSWVFTQGKNQVMTALYGISHASSLSQFEAAVQQIHAPGLNVMYGDSAGNIGWWAAARLYILPDSVSSKQINSSAILDSAAVKQVPFSENPKAINPPSGFVYSANNQPDSTSIGWVPGYYLPENRARRIMNLLEAQSDWNAEGVLEMLLDDVSPVVPEIIANLSKYLDVKELNDSEIVYVDVLNKWTGNYPLDSHEAVFYHRWMYHFLKGTFEDELGPEGFKAFMNTHLAKRLLAQMAAKETSVWWDNIRTAAVKETKANIILMAFQEAMQGLASDFGDQPEDWSWGTVHELEHKHPIGTIKLFKPLFNVGPFKVRGSMEVINNMAFNYDSTGYYSVTAGPSTRRMIDFSQVENSMSILPTGQSGNPFSPYYDDQALLYAQGGFRKMIIDSEEIQENTRHTLLLKPN
ncbi:penicillin acylase family protein [Robiginitalea sp.]|nr:penicillin acylase family protein [Robiginitalea sp.]